MTNLTPAQEEALNRAIAKWDNNSSCEFYTKSLDAIVPVVQRWLTENNKRTFDDSMHSIFRTGQEWMWFALADFIKAETPALALCIAFANAEPMVKWEKE